MIPLKPQVRPMDRAEVYALLDRNNVGRIAYARGNSIDIEPMPYVYAEGWIYGSTSRGATNEFHGETWWPVAFEVDEVESPYEWRSAVVHGGFYTLSEQGPPWEREAWAHAVELLCSLNPATFPHDHTAPNRDLVFRIAVQEVSGREARRCIPEEVPAA
jgi:uncharacterized protein